MSYMYMILAYFLNLIVIFLFREAWKMCSSLDKEKAMTMYIQELQQVCLRASMIHVLFTVLICMLS